MIMLIKNKILKKMFALIFALIFVSLTLLSIKVSAGSKSWGLSYPEPGAAPKGNESEEYLKEFDAYFIGDSKEKFIYLTFDAGYDNGYTETILDTLKEKEVPAAFFLVGTYFRDYPDLLKRIIKEGHIVGNHTMKHPDMTTITDLDSFAKELSQTEEQYKTVTGSDMPKFYRPPSGKYSEDNLQMAKELGYKTIFWSLAYADWDVKKQPTKEQAFSKLIPRIHPGAVLLLHSTSKSNALILGELIDRYREMGYEFKFLEYLAK